MSDCVLSKLNPSDRGYARRWYKGKTVRVHVIAYIEAYGPVPEGMQINHTCDVRNCVNPEHLYAGTQEDNMHDKLSRGRHRGQMTDDEKAYISLLLEKDYPVSKIAKMTGYHRSSIYRYINGGRS